MSVSRSSLESRATLLQVQRSGVIQVNEKLCLTCRECNIACSLFHEHQCNPELSRIRVDYDDFGPGFPDIRVCKQCDWPACYYACAARWDEPALGIDERTGARYIDPDNCRGCGACARACPLTPEKIGDLLQSGWAPAHLLQVRPVQRPIRGASLCRDLPGGCSHLCRSRGEAQVA